MRICLLLLLIFEIKYVLCNLAIDVDLQSNACFDKDGNDVSKCASNNYVSWILVDGRKVMQLAHGWNIAVIDHKTGHVETTRNFKTHLHRGANVELEKFIYEIKDRRIVLGVVHIDGSHQLDDRGHWALRSVAGRKTHFKGHMWSFVFIGYKDSFGTPPKFNERAAIPPNQGPARLRATISKIKYGNDMHFALKSMGFLDLGKIALHKAFSYAAYDKDITRLAFGILVLVIDHSNGELYDNTFFNTHYHKEDSYKMINYIQRLPRNMIVLAAVHSDWIRSSTPQLQQVLHQLFFTRVPTTSDGSWAMVGYTGGQSALPAEDFPISRMTTTVNKKFTYRHWVKINYFTGIRDMDECKNGQAKCNKNTVCRNTIGSYECDCKDGYEMKGNDCVDINECHTGDNICGARATCENTPGSYNCRCKDSKEKLIFGIACKEISIQISGPDCFHQSPNKPPFCKKLPIKIEVNGVNVLKKAERGFKIVVVDAHTGNVDQVMLFDTWLDISEGERMSYELVSIPKQKIVIGAVYHDENEFIHFTTRNIIKRLSGTSVPQKFFGAYAFIGFNGPILPPWVTLKSTRLLAGSVILKQRFWALPRPPYVAMNTVSVGYTRGTTVQPSMQFANTNLNHHLKPGLNIAILNSWSGKLEVFKNFNTHIEGSPQIEKMITFLNTLPTDRIVVGVVKGEAFQGIRYNPRAQMALSRLLAKPIEVKSLGESFAFFGSTFSGTIAKPAFVNQISVKPGEGPAKLSQTIRFGNRPSAIKVQLVSTGCDDPGPHLTTGKCYLAPASIKIDGKENAVNGRGFNVVVVSQINGRVLNRKRFDTAYSPAEAYKMVEFIESLPPKAIVLGIVKGDAHRFFFNGTKLKTSMKHLLGKEPFKFAARGAFAFIGFRGKHKDNWVTQKSAPHKSGGVELSANIPLTPELKIHLLSTACSDAGAFNLLCNRAKNNIIINGREYSENGRGFNLAVVNLQTGDVEKRANFDTWSRNVRGSDEMVRFLKQLPNNRLVLGVIKDEGFHSLSEEAKKTIAKLIHKDKIAISGEQESYVFVGITSTENYLWTQDAKRRQFLGPTVLDIGIPFSQPGCTFPVQPMEGRIRRLEYDVSEEVEYKCNSGYELIGKPQVCAQNGTWIGKVPKCQVLTSSDGIFGDSSATSVKPSLIVFMMMPLVFMKNIE